MRGREFNATRTDVINVNLRFIEAKSLIWDVCLGLCRTIRSLYSIEKFLQTLQMFPQKTLHPLKLTYPPKIDGWKMINFPLKWGFFIAMLVYRRVPSTLPLILTSALKVEGMDGGNFFFLRHIAAVPDLHILEHSNHLLLMEQILHQLQLTGSLSHYLQFFYIPGG